MKTNQEIVQEILILEITRKDVMESSVYDSLSKLTLVGIINSNIAALKWVLGVNLLNDLGMMENKNTKNFTELDELCAEILRQEKEKQKEAESNE